ncbi:MPV17L [Bugula neritina]|uniref:Mitochondrial inner membrane protein Mpv17 n=1 Tax=Bugula neritina TaxID=10212 RepID=A0A7J7K997_BUGNE|nr:MPV17L [Bugula neritina]
MIVGGLVLSPLYILWYNFLDKKVPGTTGRSLIKKIALDQIAAGMFGTCIFFIAMSILEKKENILTECIEKAPTAYVCNTVYWPFVMLAIFKKVPVTYQPVAVACGDFVWSIFLCYYKMKDLHKEEATSLGTQASKSEGVTPNTTGGHSLNRGQVKDS